MSLGKSVAEDLVAGNLPAVFMEEHRLLPENHPSALEYRTTLKRIHERLLKGLLGSDYNPAEHEVRFLLSVDKNPNAFIATHAKPPLIAFTTGLINMCEDESEIAGVLAHEMGHDYFLKKLGEHANGKLEELGSDLRAPLMLRKAGYAQDGLRRIISKFPDDNSLKAIFASAADPHPMKATRISALATAERALVRGKLGMGEQKNVAPEPLSAALRSSIKSATFTSHLDRRLAELGYQAASLEGKMDLLGKVIREEVATADPYQRSRRLDAAKFIRALPVDPNNPAHKAGLERLVDTIILEAGGAGSSLYKSLLDACKLENGTPLGRLKDLNTSIEQFVRAATPAEMQRAARQINALAERYPFSDTPGKKLVSFNFLNELRFSGFSMPSQEQLEALTPRNPMTPSWDAHVRSALASKDPEMVKALARLGVGIDPRLAPLAKDLNGLTYISSAAPEPNVSFFKFKAPEGARDGQYKIVFDEQGRFSDLKKLDQSALYAEEVASQTVRLARRASEERKLVQTIDWSEMEKDFGGFVSQYKEHLTPPKVLVEAEYPFAEEFVRRCGELIRKDPATFRLPIGAFFSNSYAIRNRMALSQWARNLEKQGIKASVPSIFVESMYFDDDAGFSEKSLRVDAAGAGIAPNHPYTRFVVQDPHKIFESGDKTIFLKAVRYLNLDPAFADKGPRRWILDHSPLFEGLPKHTIGELEQWLGEVRKAIPPKAEFSTAHSFIGDLVQYETLRTLSVTKEPMTLDKIRLVQEIASFHPHSYPFLQRPLREEGRRLTADFAASAKPPATLEEALHNFQRLAAGRKGFPAVFDEHPSLRVLYEKSIREAMEKLPDDAAVQHLESLLFKKDIAGIGSQTLSEIAREALGREYHQPVQYSAALADPEFKDWAIKRYANALVSRLGPDNGTEEYAKAFRQAMDRIASHAPEGNGLAIMNLLGTKECGNKLLLQKGTAGYLKEKMEALGLKNMVSHNLGAAFGETTLYALSKSQTTREATIDFLTHPFSKESAGKFIDRVENLLSEDERGRVLSETLSKEAKIEQMELLHRNFWSLPFEARFLAAKQILFNGQHANETEAIEKNVRFVLDKVMPKNDGAREEVRAGRKVIESYLEATANLEDKRIITSAMLVANAPNGATAGEKLSVGKGLNLVLSKIDPAGDKVKQAIESHPDTPAAIKAEFKGAKTGAKDPMRHEILEWVEESNKSLPEAEHIVRTGRVLGAGSYGITVEGFLADGSRRARTLLYPYVREKAENEFGILTGATEKLVERDGRFAPVTQMVRQAQKMSGVETDMDVAAKQAAAASKLYDGMKITIGGKTYTFSAAKYLGHGANHKDFELIEGQHFKDIAEAAKTAEEVAHVQGLAKAGLASELFNILSGRPFDHDRHGGQQKIQGTHFGQFDHGALSYDEAAKAVTEMSPRQKQMIGHFIGGTIKGHFVKGLSVADAMRREIKRSAHTPVEEDFLASVDRALLALGDFKTHVPNEDLKGILGSIFVSGKFDPAIKEAMRERLGSLSDRVFSQLEQAGRESGITIEAVEHAFEKSADTSPLRAAPSETILEKIPVKNEHLAAGAGLAASAAGVGLLLHANKRIQRKREEGGEASYLDRAEQVGGGMLTAGGAATAVDGAALGGAGMKNIGKFTDRLRHGGWKDDIEDMKGIFKDAQGEVHFGRVAAVAIGALAIGTSLRAYQKMKQKSEDQKKAEKGTDTSWAQKVSQIPSDRQEGLA